MRFLITAGPTREPLDAVRFLSNRSSGAMGVALANAAAAVPGAADEVTLLLGPVDSAVVAGVSEAVGVERFETTADLEALLDGHFVGCDVLVMAAAVADYRLSGERTASRAGKRAREASWTLCLEATPDLVSGCAARKRADQRVVAFALEEPAKLEERAAAKLKRKKVDAIVANPLATMDAGEVDALWLTASGKRASPGFMGKDAFAVWLVERLCESGW